MAKKDDTVCPGCIARNLAAMYTHHVKMCETDPRAYNDVALDFWSGAVVMCKVMGSDDLAEELAKIGDKMIEDGNAYENLRDLALDHTH